MNVYNYCESICKKIVQLEMLQKNNRQAMVWIIFGVLILARLILSSRLPAYILPNLPHDDGWLVSRSMYILKGDWLGPYDQFTLIKGAFSPLLLAFSAHIGVTFSGLNAVLYSFACVIFVASIRPIVERFWLQIFCFAILLFNPLTYALETGQRIYRNGMGQWQILLIFSCLIAVFLRRNSRGRSLLKWILTGGAALGVFLQTREDGAWIYVFSVGMMLSTAVVYLYEQKGPKKKIILFFLPLFIAQLIGLFLAIENFKHYGALIVNDRSGGNYAKVAGDLYAITPDPAEDLLYQSKPYKHRYYNIYVSTIEKAFSASPTLNKVSGPIRDAIRTWGSWGDFKDGQLPYDFMLFALRDGVKNAGYYKNLPETEAFYGRVHEELQTAFKNKILIERGFAISPLIKRLQKRDFENAFALMPQAFLDVISFSGIRSEAILAKGSQSAIQEFNVMAGGEFYTIPSSLVGSGWVFAENSKSQIKAGLYDSNGLLIVNLPLNLGEDVYKAFNYKYENAKSPRFSFNIPGYSLASGVKLRFFDNSGFLLLELPADGSISCGQLDDAVHYCIDSLKSEPSTEEFYTRLANRANGVIILYQKIFPFLSLMGLLLYIYMTAIVFLVSPSKKRNPELLSAWLIMSWTLLTIILFIFSMCLVSATTFNTLFYIYTAPAHILLLIFCSITMFIGVRYFPGFKGLK